MKTFFVRACKKKKKKRKYFRDLDYEKRENGFRKNTSKKGEIKEKQKITVPSFDFFHSFYSSSFFISRSFPSRARRARVNHPRIGRKCSSTSLSFFHRETRFVSRSMFNAMVNRDIQLNNNTIK